MQLFDIIFNWTPWAIAALLAVALLISAIQPQTIAQSIQVLSSPIQRRYTKGGNPPLLFLLRAVFQLGTISLGLLMAVAAFMDRNAVIQPEHYGLVVVGVMAMVLIKVLLDKWIQLTFRFTMNEKIYYTYRSELWQVMSMAMWIVLFLSPIISTTATWIAIAGIWVMYCGLLWWKIMQAFGWDIQHITFSLVYVFHLEVLPMAAMVGGIGWMIDD